MPLHTILLNYPEHADFFEQNRVDPITKDPFQVGDRIVLCASCKSAFLVDTWTNIGRRHCEQENTLDRIPVNEASGIFAVPVIQEFSVSAVVVLEGTSIKLKWEVENARTCEIDQQIGEVSEKGELEVMPLGIRESVYTLTAISRTRITRKQVKIRIIPLPTIKRVILPDQPELHIRQPKLSVPDIKLPALDSRPAYSFGWLRIGRVQVHLPGFSFVNLELQQLLLYVREKLNR